MKATIVKHKGDPLIRLHAQGKLDQMLLEKLGERDVHVDIISHVLKDDLISIYLKVEISEIVKLTW